ncbi:MAG: LysM peptidoglycan-binding domain-containing protein [Candidatus Limnocylindrales bacterium]
MSGRPVEPVEIPAACPFLAFEDDRDRRSTAPDHRHRCYAEPRPAPRALAHQERYCLTRDFPSCPTFQAWARREAARESEPGATRDVPAGHAPTDPGSWLATSGAAAGMAAAGGAAASGAGSAAAGGASASGARASGGGARAARPAPAEVGQLAAFEDPMPERDLADEAAPEADAPGHEELAALVVGGAVVAAAGAGSEAGAGGATGGADADVPPFLAGRTSGTRTGSASARPAKAAPTGSTPTEGAGPPWERPHKNELYPSLRTRSGLPSLPPVALALIALVVAAVILFMLPSILGNSGGAGPGDSTSVPPLSAAPTSIAPTIAVGPTPFVYTVKAGDLLGTIARHFGVTLAQLEAANPQIKDPNKIAVGDKITIPVPGASGAASQGP